MSIENPNIEDTFRKIKDILEPKTDELLPCPFCGNSVEIREIECDSDYETSSYWNIECEHCDISMGSDYVIFRQGSRNAKFNDNFKIELQKEKTKIIKKWNRRV